LDEDVRRERQLISHDNETTKSSVVLVKDLVKTFKKRKTKSSGNRIYTAVDHLNFHVQTRACFGLLGTGWFMNNSISNFLFLQERMEQEKRQHFVC
jgi:ABC-type glutathione transport system ATPase component